jgi:hypothetical protein
MPGTIREQLLEAMPGDDPRRVFYAPGRPHLPYNELSLTNTLEKFKTEFLPLCPLSDPLDRQIRVVDTNFRKLINLKHKALGKKAKAYKIIEEIETGTFDPKDYSPLELDRIRTLFWIPEVIQDPDAIYKNNHRVVEADEVFVCVYNKGGAKVKLVFTSTFGPKFNPRVEIVTSYLTDERSAMFAARGKPLYLKNREK